MSGRFSLMTPDLLQKLSDDSQNKNTNRSTNNWVNVYKQWATERQCELTLESQDYATLNSNLGDSFL